MIAIFFTYGLAFFCLGLAVALEARRVSDLPLRRQLPWLAAFGFVHALVEWSDMFLLTNPPEPHRQMLLVGRTVLLPISALLLVRFGAGTISETGPLPLWLWVAPLLLAAPTALLIAHALITATVDPVLAIDVWSRYLLYFVGSLLAGIGFLRQRHIMIDKGLGETSNLMLGAALLFFFNAFMAGLIVPQAPYGLAPWLNYGTVREVTGLPVQVWRMVSALALTFFVVRAMDVFETKRAMERQQAEIARSAALETVRESEARFRTIFELAPFGMETLSADGQSIQANHAMQQMLAYSAEELRGMVYTDYTHPDDIALSKQLVQELAQGKFPYFRMEKRYFRKDGGLVWGNVAVTAVRDLAGQLLYFIAMVEDVTQRKLMEEALRVERERAQQTELLTESNARALAEQWFNVLVNVSRRISRMEDVDEVLAYIVGQAQRLLDTDTVSLGLLDDSGYTLRLEYQALGSSAHALNPPQLIDNPFLLEMLHSDRAYRFPEDAGLVAPGATGAVWTCITTGEPFLRAAVVPLQFDGRVVGGIWAGRFAPHSFTPTDLIGLESIADQAVIALQHALMAARLQSLAVLQERSRIAREMHDGLAQVLGYLSLQVQTLVTLVQRGENEQALAELHRTRENIKIAQADVRENILSLRTTLAEGDGVLAALREYVTEFGLQTGTETAVITEVADTLRLSPLAEVQMVRIVQEALANVRKHAQAAHVTVTLLEENNQLAVTIADDGVGFEPAGKRRHFGLETMRERAEIADGSLAVRSTPTGGTRVTLRLPLLRD
jgi:PAS domain S-box-containing protein